MLFKIRNNSCETAIWRFLEDTESNDNEFDVWSIMKSEYIRNFYKNNIKLSTEGMIDIIANSYTDIKVKLNYIEELKIYCINKGIKEDVKLLEMIEKYYEFFIDLLYNPMSIILNNKIIYTLNKSMFKGNEFEEYQWPNTDGLYIIDENYINSYEFPKKFTNIIDLISYFNDICNTSIYYIEIDIMNSNGEVDFLCTYDIKCEDKQYCIDINTIPYNSNLYKIFKEKNNYSLNDILSYVNGSNSFYLPFINKDIVTISIPWIEQKIKGEIYRELSDIWYFWLLPEGYDTNNWEYYNSVSLNTLRIQNCSNKFSIFDFINI